MSARREARARMPHPSTLDNRGGIPAALLLGPCIEVWADDKAATPSFSARRRWGQVRDLWAEAEGMDKRDRMEAMPCRTQWSVDFLIEQGRGERAIQLLGEAGCVPGDVPELRADAEDLLKKFATTGRKGR